ncbi:MULTISPECIES: iron ABC transporter permease [unclassified Herbaspirillum]|uniref:FecCD family ABC transporter permease n=1 Tax=unclassified Herbaspirillum TaxID=2624150 RepID=UPI001151849B|nr:MULTISPECIES: iron ABC transporter permease [unclassified Herbaspirillum]MBB5392107.1 iron complex transport system permease protein [Herbaspirillum sp. SJZ102]TQK13564.1 iron complex transport system permease protein [Herbaspirillum sp. SJZ130]TQK15567.1 iron complex transport system permease protein [Herbaspirillum sp. SJZ106]TWC71467.1 iron complex transport system permease protein [Herbaspirillum sp. SJZ099]
MRRYLWPLSALLLLSVSALAAAALCGSSGCLRPSASADAVSLMLSLRVPRALTAFAVGALLALAGALMQVLLRNPLADPYVLGLSGGSAAGALLAMLAALQFGLPPRLVTAPGALLGAALAVLLLFGLVRQSLRHLALSPLLSSQRLLLTGVMLAAGFGAIISLALSIAPDSQLRGMVFWLIGDLDDARLLPLAATVLLLALLWAVRHAPALNLLARGDSFAQLLGVPVLRLRVMTLCAASAATAAAVAMAGTVGFVGLVVPHTLRLLVGNDQRLLLPASVLAGGAALTLADLAARTVVAPTQLPVGVITALVGVPVFLWLLARSRM